MTDLIKRLEKAEEGCPFLDRKIWVALEFDGNRSPVDAPEYTTSIDTALALAERVLPGWCWMIERHKNGAATAGLHEWNAYREADRFTANTSALALCAAILKATDTGGEA
jgi:hypothetical protein